MSCHVSSEMPEFDEVDVASPRGQNRSPNHSGINSANDRIRRNAWMRTSLRRSPAQYVIFVYFFYFV